jgi:hypothetical protein
MLFIVAELVGIGIGIVLSVVGYSLYYTVKWHRMFGKWDWFWLIRSTNAKP